MHVHHRHSKNIGLGSHGKVFMHVFIRVSFVGICTVVIQGMRVNLIQEKRASCQPIKMAVHKDFRTLSIPPT